MSLKCGPPEQKHFTKNSKGKKNMWCTASSSHATLRYWEFVCGSIHLFVELPVWFIIITFQTELLVCCCGWWFELNSWRESFNLNNTYYSLLQKPKARDPGLRTLFSRWWWPIIYIRLGNKRAAGPNKKFLFALFHLIVGRKMHQTLKLTWSWQIQTQK